ncbi:MAG: bacillithiol biosynthesis cysteine-adding enzyme BshC [Chitinophagaceae bacterium]|nr:MAG: bacillithiol biosynthesis cysteine-adding enzyme BshC [Chitinophagaceae bacterium]
MPFTASHIPYRDTRSFSAIAIDYAEGQAALKPFYTHEPDLHGIKDAIAHRKAFAGNRSLLVSYLKEQYSAIQMNPKLQANIDSLLHENTFTITTAHQPNIFTGHLYFVYKILHAIKLAEHLKVAVPENNFVPVYYMGSEDADLDELGEVFINGTHYRWQTDQTGAVGRMKIDKAFIELIALIEGQLSVEPYGHEILQQVKKAYTLNKTIEQATFEFVHGLFDKYGLLIFLPDNAIPKKEFNAVVQKELAEQFSSKAVQETVKGFPEQYKVQAAGRDINLFYLQDGSRERIEKKGDSWILADQSKAWTNEELLLELQNDAKPFSANVILRPVFQEMILPNIAFIGGGGEIAYWLELKKVFEVAGVPYPVLILRNSFLVIDKKTADNIQALEMTAVDFFLPASEILKRIVNKHTTIQLDLAQQKAELNDLYKKIELLAAVADPTLQQHTQALFVAAEKRLIQLEKKMYKAEKLRFEAQQRQIEKIKGKLYPNNTLQERIDNLLPWYAKYGPQFIDMLYDNSQALEQQFYLLEEVDN